MNVKVIYCLGLLFIMCNSQTKAIDHRSPQPAYTHLYEVNAVWEHFREAAPLLEIQFQSDIERISYHLTLVEQYLRNHCPKSIKGQALKKRLALLDSLQAYAKASIFPQNIYHNERRPYFIDHRGVHCAVGYLMKASNSGALAARIRQEHNFDYLRDIKTEGVSKWAKEWGFELTELAWIQPGYMPYTSVMPLLNGTNGTVNRLAYQYQNGIKLLFTGDFTQIDTVACSGIGYYQNGEMHCLGGGLIGDIQDMDISTNVMVAGSLDFGGMLYPAAIYDNISWQFLDIPGRQGAMATAIAKGYYPTHSVELAISHAAIPGKQEIWYLLTDGSWEKKATIHGTIFDMESLYDPLTFQEKGFYAGAFDSVTLHSTSAADTTVAANNVIAWTYQSGDWFTFGNDIPDTVRIIKPYSGIVYFGGTTSITGSNICLSRYSGGYLSALLTINSFVDTVVHIYDIDFYQNQLLIVGEFRVIPMLGTYGNNVMQYDILSNYLLPLGDFNKPVRNVSLINNQIYIGGEFDSCYSNPYGPLPHLARIDFYTSNLAEESTKFMPISYPNPAQDRVNIDLGANMEEIQVQLCDLSGRVLMSRECKQQQLLQLELIAIPAGMYLLQINADGQRKTEKLSVSGYE